jgi:hypothetical protein
LSMTMRVAVDAPVVDGVKVTWIGQLLPPETDCTQSPEALVTEKLAALAPESDMLEIFSVALPGLERVSMSAALVVATVCDGNASVEGVSTACGAKAAIPLPLRVVVCGDPLALSATERIAVKSATDDGVKVMWIGQLPPEERDCTQSPEALVTEKFAALAPEREMLAIFSVALPGLERVSVSAALVVPTVCEGKASVEGASTALGTAAAIPLPLRVTACGEPPASSVTERVAVKFATDDGVKVTAILQLVPAARVAPQLEVSAKLLAFVPPMPMLAMLSTAVPVLERVTVSAALVVLTV